MEKYQGSLRPAIYVNMMRTETHLSARIRMVDCLLQMTHEQKISSMEPIVVKCIMIHMTQYSPSTQPARVIVGINVFTKTIHYLYRSFGSSWQFTLKYILLNFNRLLKRIVHFKRKKTTHSLQFEYVRVKFVI